MSRTVWRFGACVHCGQYKEISSVTSRCRECPAPRRVRKGAETGYQYDEAKAHRAAFAALNANVRKQRR